MSCAVRVPLLAPPTHYLHPGQLVVSAEPCEIMTILGSCVSVCVFDPMRRVGGANHFLLPDFTQGVNDSPRYGPAAIRALIRQVVALGATRDRLTAKLFGGANVLRAFQIRERHLGIDNVEVARRVLAEEGVSVAAEDVGGTRGRKLVFSTVDGSAWVQAI